MTGSPAPTPAVAGLLTAEQVQATVDAIAECARAAIAKAAEPVKRPAGRRCMNCGATSGMLCPMSDNGEGPHEFEEE